MQKETLGLRGDIMIKDENTLRLERTASLEMINQGNTAEIYAYGANKILKLFRHNMPKEAVVTEYEKARVIQSKLKNTPKVSEFVLCENRYGIVYERIAGIDMLKVMLLKPHKINFYARKLAHFHADIINKELDVGITVKQKLNREIDFPNGLSDANKKIIKDYLNRLPDGNQLCHFDFHPGNIMFRQDNPIIIDWMTACTGDPHADAARTYLLLQHGELSHANFLVKKGLRIFERHIAKLYYEEYKKITGASNHDIEQWILPVAAARLMESIPDHEKGKLLEVIYDRLQTISSVQASFFSDNLSKIATEIKSQKEEDTQHGKNNHRKGHWKGICKTGLRRTLHVPGSEK